MSGFAQMKKTFRITILAIIAAIAIAGIRSVGAVDRGKIFPCKIDFDCKHHGFKCIRTVTSDGYPYKMAPHFCGKVENLSDELKKTLVKMYCISFTNIADAYNNTINLQEIHKSNDLQFENDDR
eukprot:GHVS01062653.1.p1 GENE.GHVS01062653.1~~GHVS01062653.1.p1  ORF type:complete len:124 (+),score=5.25 GHVS01062653.1:237-608(+)